MGAFASRQNAAVEEQENAAHNAYKYPPKSGNFFSSHFIMGGERFDTSQPEAYLFGENADLNFLGTKPTAFPYPPPQASEPTKTLKSLVNIRKETVRFVKATETATKIHGDGVSTKNSHFNIEFVFDADVKCAITIYYFCTEEIGSTSLSYQTRDAALTSETFHYKKGASQVFYQPTHIFNPSLFPEDDLQYSAERDVYPVVIHCVVEEGMDDIRQSHTTICVVDNHSDGTYCLRALKQKIFVDGLCYLLQEIYGIENKNLNRSFSDDECEENGSECVICMSDQRDTLILPCRHLCLCNTCANSLRYQANNCPICRAPFRALLQLRAVQRSAANFIIAPNHLANDVDNIPAGYMEVSLIEALNGPPPKSGRPITPIVGTADAEHTTSFIENLSETLDKNKSNDKKAKESVPEMKNETSSSIPLVRSHSGKNCKERLSNRSQSIKLVNEKTPNTLVDDEDSEAEKLSPLLNSKIVKLPINKSLSNSLSLGSSPNENRVDTDEIEDLELNVKNSKKKCRNLSGIEETTTITAGDDSDYFTPEDPHTTILSPVSNEKLNVKENLSTKESNILSPLTLLKDSVMSLPDSPQSSNSQVSRSSGDSYSSSSSTKQLLSSVITTTNDLPTHISDVDHIRIADDDKKNKSTTSIVNV